MLSNDLRLSVKDCWWMGYAAFWDGYPREGHADWLDRDHLAWFWSGWKFAFAESLVPTLGWSVSIGEELRN